MNRRVVSLPGIAGLSLGLLLVLSAASAGEETLRTFAPDTPGAFTARSDGTPRTVTLLTVNDPGIRRSRYAIAGDVRYRDVQGASYLEMWSVFPHGRAFTRTLAEAGPMQGLSGSSDWRPFLLPFFNEPGAPAPQQLIVGIVLRGAGTVEVRSLRLLQFADGEAPFVPRGAWWSGRTGGMVGGVAGGLLGCVGALVGSLAARGRARRLVIGTLLAIGGLGVAALAAGALALAKAQPYDVYYPLLLLGLLGTVVPLGLLPSLRRRYQDLELRRMQAADLR